MAVRESDWLGYVTVIIFPRVPGSPILGQNSYKSRLNARNGSLPQVDAQDGGKK
jgi:hypothetical protein